MIKGVVIVTITTSLRFVKPAKSFKTSIRNYRWLAISKFKSVYFKSNRWLR